MVYSTCENRFRSHVIWCQPIGKPSCCDVISKAYLDGEGPPHSPLGALLSPLRRLDTDAPRHVLFRTSHWPFQRVPVVPLVRSVPGLAVPLFRAGRVLIGAGATDDERPWQDGQFLGAQSRFAPLHPLGSPPVMQLLVVGVSQRQDGHRGRFSPRMHHC